MSTSSGAPHGESCGSIDSSFSVKADLANKEALRNKQDTRTGCPRPSQGRRCAL